jgi:hypothetical protein
VVVDTDFWNENKMSDPEGNWLTTPSALAPGTVTRTLTMFNDTFAGERVDLAWTAVQHRISPELRAAERSDPP